MSSSQFLTKVARGAVWFLGFRLGSAVAILLANGLLARMLSLEDFGRYVFFLSLVTVLGTVSGHGFGTAAVRLIAEGTSQARHGLVWRTVLVAFLLSLAAGLLLAIFALWWPIPGLLRYLGVSHPMLAGEALLAMLWLVSYGVRDAGGFVYRGLQIQSLAALYQTAGGNFAMLGFYIIIYFLGYHDFLTVLAVTAAASVISMSACWIGIARRMRHLPADAERHRLPFSTMLRVGGFLSLPNLIQLNAREICVWVVGATSGLADVALFGAANRLMQLVALPVVAAQQVTQPLIAEARYSGGLAAHAQGLRLANGIVFLMMAGMFLAIILFGQWLLGAIFQPNFVAAWPILLVLCSARFFQAFLGPSQTVLSMMGYEAALARDALFQALILVGGGFLLSQYMGAIGAAVALAISIVGFSIYRTITVRQRFGVWLTPIFDPRGMVKLLRDLKQRRGRKGRRTEDVAMGMDGEP